jgi:hypothetical protein
VSNVPDIWGREQAIFWWNDEIYFVQDQQTGVDFYSARWLKHSTHVAALVRMHYSDAKHSLLSLLNTACLAEKEQILN